MNEHTHTLYTNIHHHTDIGNLVLVLPSLIQSPPGQRVQPRSENTFSALLNNRLWGCRDACPCCSLSPPLHLVFRQSNKSILLWQHAAYTSNLLLVNLFSTDFFSPSNASFLWITTDRLHAQQRTLSPQRASTNELSGPLMGQPHIPMSKSLSDPH